MERDYPKIHAYVLGSLHESARSQFLNYPAFLRAQLITKDPKNLVKVIEDITTKVSADETEEERHHRKEKIRIEFDNIYQYKWETVAEFAVRFKATYEALRKMGGLGLTTYETDDLDETASVGTVYTNVELSSRVLASKFSKSVEDQVCEMARGYPPQRDRS